MLSLKEQPVVLWSVTTAKKWKLLNRQISPIIQLPLDLGEEGDPNF